MFFNSNKSLSILCYRVPHRQAMPPPICELNPPASRNLQMETRNTLWETMRRGALTSLGGLFASEKRGRRGALPRQGVWASSLKGPAFLPGTSQQPWWGCQTGHVGTPRRTCSIRPDSDFSPGTLLRRSPTMSLKQLGNSVEGGGWGLVSRGNHRFPHPPPKLSEEETEAWRSLQSRARTGALASQSSCKPFTMVTVFSLPLTSVYHLRLIKQKSPGAIRREEV